MIGALVKNTTAPNSTVSAVYAAISPTRPVSATAGIAATSSTT